MGDENILQPLPTSTPVPEDPGDPADETTPAATTSPEPEDPGDPQFPTVSAACSTSTLEFTAENGKVLANGEEFFIKGANWFGFETTTHTLHGLWGKTTIAAGLDLLANNGFNAVRLPFAVDAVLDNPLVPNKELATEPSLQGKRMLEVLDAVIAACEERSLLVMLDNHHNQAAGEIEELWYDSVISVEDVKAAWTVLAQRYCTRWNVFAADLKNEPHGAAGWGTGVAATDWRLGAEDLGNHVQGECGRWLIFVEGVAQNVVGDTSWWPGWWGGKLQGAEAFPVRLSNDAKLVYSPHVYGPSVTPTQPFFSSNPLDAALLRFIWDEDFGSVPAETGQPVVVGEWGGWYSGKDKQWQDLLAPYLVEKRLGSFYWCLNPNSADTGGLLYSDWTTPNQQKLNLLSTLPATEVVSVCRAPATTREQSTSHAPTSSSTTTSAAPTTTTSSAPVTSTTTSVIVDPTTSSSTTSAAKTETTPPESSSTSSAAPTTTTSSIPLTSTTTTASSDPTTSSSTPAPTTATPSTPVASTATETSTPAPLLPVSSSSSPPPPPKPSTAASVATTAPRSPLTSSLQATATSSSSSPSPPAAASSSTSSLPLPPLDRSPSSPPSSSAASASARSVTPHPPPPSTTPPPTIAATPAPTIAPDLTTSPAETAEPPASPPPPLPLPLPPSSSASTAAATRPALLATSAAAPSPPAASSTAERSLALPSSPRPAPTPSPVPTSPAASLASSTFASTPASGPASSLPPSALATAMATASPTRASESGGGDTVCSGVAAAVVLRGVTPQALAAAQAAVLAALQEAVAAAAAAAASPDAPDSPAVAIDGPCAAASLPAAERRVGALDWEGSGRGAERSLRREEMANATITFFVSPSSSSSQGSQALSDLHLALDDPAFLSSLTASLQTRLPDLNLSASWSRPPVLLDALPLPQTTPAAPLPHSSPNIDPSPSPAASPDTQASPQLGLAVGLGCGAAVLVAAAVGAWAWRRRGHGAGASKGDDYAALGLGPVSMVTVKAAQAHGDRDASGGMWKAGEDLEAAAAPSAGGQPHPPAREGDARIIPMHPPAMSTGQLTDMCI